MKTALSVILTLFMFVTVLAVPQWASALTLNTIGASQTTNGNPGTQWWYTGQNPILGGTANPGSTVTITINGATNTATANDQGNWTFTPTTLTTGDHVIAISADGQNINFTLYTGQTQPATTTTTSTNSATTQTLPVSGAFETTLLLILGGGLLILGGWKLSHMAK